jgi:hypothetical protein
MTHYDALGAFSRIRQSVEHVTEKSIHYIAQSQSDLQCDTHFNREYIEEKTMQLFIIPNISLRES